jgi:hypothetical protein
MAKGSVKAELALLFICLYFSRIPTVSTVNFRKLKELGCGESPTDRQAAGNKITTKVARLSQDL